MVGPLTAELHPLGRLHAIDQRDQNYPLRRHLATGPLPTYHYWTPGAILDQGQIPACVGAAWRQFLQTSPVRTRTADPAFLTIYAGAQRLDEWEGEGYDGTSLRAGAKFLQATRFIDEYAWAQNPDEVREWLLTKGPVALGSNWYSAMDEPDKTGTIHVRGLHRGGHAYLATGYSQAKKAIRCVQSWGTGWGQKGLFWLPDSDLDLLWSDGGEACVALQVR